MLPTNVMSFMKKMVATEESQQNTENTGTFGKLKQTLSSSLLTAQDKVNKITPRSSATTDNTESNHEETPPEQTHINQTAKSDVTKISSRVGSCRVCLKAFKQNEYSKTCFECNQRVCEDCASYSKLEENDDLKSWRCSVCRRKMSSRICIPQDSVDSMLEIPVMDTLQRRHSDIKMGSVQCLGTMSGTGPSLAPPRSPELRRHSDVSPASLKELEKLKGAKSGEMEWSRGKSNVSSRCTSPTRTLNFEPPSKSPSRRQSIRAVTRQRSYDDDIKNAETTSNTPVMDHCSLPAPMPRRKSAYDVYAPALLQSTSNFNNNEMVDKGGSSRRGSFRMTNMDSNRNDETSSPDKNMSLLLDDDRRMRRRGSQLPEIPTSKDRGMGSDQPTHFFPNIPTYQCPALEDLEAPKRQTSLDGESIKIVIHDVDSGPLCAAKRRVILRRDPLDKAHRTRGFGMRVVGGKTGADGRLFAYIVWTVPGGPAEKGGLQQGDKILEWGGTSLIDRSFEEVCGIMDRTGDIVELLVEHATDFRMCDLLDDSGQSGGNSIVVFNEPRNSTRKSSEGMITGLAADSEQISDKSPSSPTRRKLPKTPEQLAKERQVSGRVQLQVWYHGDRNELVISLMAGDELSLRNDSLGYGSLPEAYAKVRIVPKTGDNVAQTEVSLPSTNPIWNATLTFTNVLADKLTDCSIEVVLWDLIPHSEPAFLGECTVGLQKALLDDRAIWYRLEDPRGLKANSMRNLNSPKNSLSSDPSKFIRGSENRFQRSVSDDIDSMTDSTFFLHPDHAWNLNSRRGSSQSEKIEIEVYQLGKDFSKSLPGSRRSSFQDQEKAKAIETTSSINSLYTKDTRKKDYNEKSSTGKLKEFGRSMSLSRDTERRLSKNYYGQNYYTKEL